MNMPKSLTSFKRGEKISDSLLLGIGKILRDRVSMEPFDLKISIVELSLLTKISRPTIYAHKEIIQLLKCLNEPRPSKGEIFEVKTIRQEAQAEKEKHRQEIIQIASEKMGMLHRIMNLELALKRATAKDRPR